MWQAGVGLPRQYIAARCPMMCSAGRFHRAGRPCRHLAASRVCGTAGRARQREMSAKKAHLRPKAMRHCFLLWLWCRRLLCVHPVVAMLPRGRHPPWSSGGRSGSATARWNRLQGPWRPVAAFSLLFFVVLYSGAALQEPMGAGSNEQVRLQPAQRSAVGRGCRRPPAARQPNVHASWCTVVQYFRLPCHRSAWLSRLCMPG